MSNTSVCKCKDCEKRYPGCHSTCQSYLDFRKAKDRENAIAREEAEIIRMSFSYVSSNKRRKR